MVFELLMLIALVPHADASPFDPVASVLERRCLSCHSQAEQKGDFSLETAEFLRRDDSAVKPGSPDESRLVEVVTPMDGEAEMPKDAEPIPADEIAILRQWIKEGAKWPDGRTLSPPRITSTDWWSLKPIQHSSIPTLKGTADAQHPIDAFILTEQRKHGLTGSPEADRRTLIRRLSYDLVGLPPEPGDVRSFQSATEADAYERLVDRLLASPRFGERYARHWLDVVHFGETHGYDKDKPRENAWPYRDYVIRAFNEDKPYDRFVQEQLAGDVLAPGSEDGVTALGFISAGPWDFIGHAEVPETKIDGKIARHLDRDDMVANTINTFCSLTVHCAQCHNHKFDPITQEDYYRLQAVFAAVDRADRPFDKNPQIGAKRAELTDRRRALRYKLGQVESKIAEQGGAPLAELDKQIKSAQKPGLQALAEFGYHSQIEASDDKPKWVQVDLGEVKSLSAIVLRPCHDDFAGIGAGFGFPKRYRIECSNDPAFETRQTIVDRTDSDQPNPKLDAVRFDAEGRSARYVRVTATKLALRQNDYIFALAELEVLDAHDANLTPGKPTSSLDSIEAIPRWSQANLTDGRFPTTTGAIALSELQKKRTTLLAQSVSKEVVDQQASIQQELVRIEVELSLLPKPMTTYAATIHEGSGTFLGTGANGGKPRPIHLLARGDVTKPGALVSPGAIAAIAPLPSLFEESTEGTESQSRLALAWWITDDRNPLTWRSIVNRLWLYHMGRGIVGTPNDMGRMGEPPTHMELLDWLALELRDGDRSLKRIHRMIVESATYRQSSSDGEAPPRTGNSQWHPEKPPGGIHASKPATVVAGAPDSASMESAGYHARSRSDASTCLSTCEFTVVEESNDNPVIDKRDVIDADNKYIWRFHRRKLNAEAVRDSMLAVAGELDLAMGGPSFKDFVIEHPEHSPHYEYHLFDPADRRAHRRSVYRFLVRSKQQPFMATLDCADPSMLVEKRNETISPLQALAMLNNRLSVLMADRFADRVAAERAGIEDQIAWAFELALARPPSPGEQESLAGLAKAYGLATACRAIMNLNEFAFVD